MAFDPGQKLTPEELRPIRDLILKHAGIFFEEKKFYFIEKRVLRRMKDTNSKTARDYFRLLSLGSSQDELNELTSALTTNETYFYRNIPQLESFAEEALKAVVEEKRKKRDFRIKIWSAACSSGEEPYTLAMMLKEYLPDFAKWRIEIEGTDIDHYIIKKAQAGVYEKRSVKDVPAGVLRKYFTERNGRFNVNDDIKSLVKFKYLNLMDRRGMRSQMGMDFVFCRNVLIYFDEEARKEVVGRIYDALNKGGFIFLGHSESVGKISAMFKLVKFKKSLSYQK